MVAGSVMMPALVSDMMGEQANQYAPRKTHFSPKARRVIFINLSGGVSHLDTFDHKPQLYREHGKEIAKGDHPEIQNRPGYERIFLKTPQWQFKRYGQCGKDVSSLFPEVARCVDDISFINSMHTSHSNHYNATLGMHTGSFTVTRPSAIRAPASHEEDKGRAAAAHRRTRWAHLLPNALLEVVERRHAVLIRRRERRAVTHHRRAFGQQL